MKRVIISAAAIMMLASSAFAGDNINRNNNSSSANASNSNSNYSSVNNAVSNSIKNRLQPGNVSGFGGGGPCTEGFSLSFPGGGASIQTQCREGKQAIKAGTVQGVFGNKATRDWLCDSDKDLYGLDHCVQRRIVKSGIVQRRDRAKYGN